jgi:hypothetical protein
MTPYSKFSRSYAEPIRRAWVEGLRSGEFLAGSGCLVDANGNCCPLGVLCQVFYTMYPGRVKKEKDAEGRTTFDGEALVAPPLIAEIVGLTDRDGRFRDRTGRFDRFIDPDTDHGWVSVANGSDAGVIDFEAVAEVVEDRRSHIFVE